MLFLNALQRITENQAAFIQLLNQPEHAGEGGGAGGGAGAGAGAGAGGPVAASGAGLPPGTMAIQVSPEEKAAIDRVRMDDIPLLQILTSLEGILEQNPP